MSMFGEYEPRRVTNAAWNPDDEAYRSESVQSLKRPVGQVSVETIASDVTVVADRATRRDQGITTLFQVQTDDPGLGASLEIRKGHVHVGYEKRRLSVTTPGESTVEFDSEDGIRRSVYGVDRSNHPRSTYITSKGDWVILPDGDRVEGGNVYHRMLGGTGNAETTREGDAPIPAGERSITVGLTKGEERTYALKSGIGRITAKDLHGDLDVENGKGAVHVINHQEGAVRIVSEEGSVAVTGSEGEDSVLHGGLSITTTKGDVTVADVEAQIAIRTGSGNVDAQHITVFNSGDDEGGITTETGDINVSVMNPNIHVVAQSPGGIVFPDNGFYVTDDQILTPMDEQGQGVPFREVRGFFGAPSHGGDTLLLKSEIGAIRFDKADTTTPAENT
jgi:hypothetical protein